MIVSLRNLDFHFGVGALRNQILHNVTLDIAPGEIVLLTGPSGSGKTTLLTLMGALRSAQTGSLRVLGRELRDATKRQLAEVRKHIGFIFQAHNLLVSLTAQQNVQMALDLHPQLSARERWQKAEAMLCAVGLQDRLDYYPAKLSGGQKQRVAIARALAADPQLVLADEPTAALDSKTGRDIVDILQRLARERGVPILLVTHDSRILDIADRILRMEDGRLINEHQLNA